LPVDLSETELLFSELGFSELVFSELDSGPSVFEVSDLLSAEDDELEPLPFAERPVDDFLA
jgi:hypothetical protein